MLCLCAVQLQRLQAFQGSGSCLARLPGLPHTRSSWQILWGILWGIQVALVQCNTLFVFSNPNTSYSCRQVPSLFLGVLMLLCSCCVARTPLLLLLLLLLSL